MNTWQILIFNMLVLLSSHPQTPKQLTPRQQQEFVKLHDGGKFKVPASLS